MTRVTEALTKTQPVRSISNPTAKASRNTVCVGPVDATPPIFQPIGRQLCLYSRGSRELAFNGRDFMRIGRLNGSFHRDVHYGSCLLSTLESEQPGFTFL